jgi:hypothetical protein
MSARMMSSAARDPETLAGGIDESQDRCLDAAELGFPVYTAPRTGGGGVRDFDG